MGHKKINPRRIPLSMAEFKRQQKVANTQTLKGMAFLTYMTVGDIFDPTPEQMEKFHHKFMLNGEMLNAGEINVPEVLRALKDDYALEINFE